MVMNDERNNPIAGDAAGTDPWLDSLLDEALRPDTVDDSIPAGLCDRVFEATRHRLAPSRRSVLARIGPSRLSAIAAAIVLATGAGVWLAVSNSGQREESNLALNNQPLLPEARAWPGEAVDQDLAALSMRVESSQREWDKTNTIDVSDGADEADISNASSVFE